MTCNIKCLKFGDFVFLKCRSSISCAHEVKLKTLELKTQIPEDKYKNFQQVNFFQNISGSKVNFVL